MMTIVVEYRTFTANIYLKYSEIQSISYCFSSLPMAIVVYLPSNIYKREVVKLESRLKTNKFWMTDGIHALCKFILLLFICLFVCLFIFSDIHCY